MTTQNTLALTVALTLLIFGCKTPSKSKDSISLKDLSPTSKLPDQTNLVLAGTKIPVDLSTRQTGQEFAIELSAFGEIVELERYRLDENSFALVEVLGENYDPAMPILQSEMVVNSPWKWKGEISAAGIRHRATAEIFLTDDPKALFAPNSKVWKVKATLTIDAGEQTTAERVLTFSFVPGRGLVSREFGLASSRIPIGSDPPTSKESPN